MFVAATGNRLLLRQYAIAFKKSGAQVPRTELAEIGPRIDFSIRRSRGAPDEIQTQSMKQPKLDKKKVSHHCQVAAECTSCDWKVRKPQHVEQHVQLPVQLHIATKAGSKTCIKLLLCMLHRHTTAQVPAVRQLGSECTVFHVLSQSLSVLSNP